MTDADFEKILRRLKLPLGKQLSDGRTYRVTKGSFVRLDTESRQLLRNFDKMLVLSDGAGHVTGGVLFYGRFDLQAQMLPEYKGLGYMSAIHHMLQGVSAVENGFTNPAYNLSYDEYKEWLQITDNNSRGIDLPEDWIPYTTYVLYIDDVPVGYGRVRHSSSEYMETVVGAGNLGYGIAKGYRGKGYGSVLFKELLKKCKEIGYKEIKLFPMKSNEPTVKIMLKNGGQIIGDFKDLKYIIRIPLEQTLI